MAKAKCRSLKHLIADYADRRGIERNKLAAFIGMSASTLQRRENNQSEFSVSELSRIKEKLGIPTEKLCEAIGWAPAKTFEERFK